MVDMKKVMDAATSENTDAFSKLWKTLTEQDRTYALGYFAGYVEAVHHTQMAEESYNEVE